MNNAGAFWKPEEEEQIKTFYLKYKMEIPEIAKIHKRSNEAIRLRLIKLNLIKDDNFIKAELLGTKRETNEGINDHPLMVLTEILSKHLSQQNEKIKLLEKRIDELSSYAKKIN